MRRPRVSYTIWFSQRTGSTWLCDLLAATGVAGRPAEWFNFPDPRDLFGHYGVTSLTGLKDSLYQRGCSPNGVFGAKQGYSEPYFGQLLTALNVSQKVRLRGWGEVFPNHKHIFMTRRNKIRLAVSWWRAIQSREWHRLRGEPPCDVDLTGSYSFEAIDQLLCEAQFREAGLQELFEEAGIAPYTVVYEDMQRDPNALVSSLIDFLGIKDKPRTVDVARFEKIADDVSEEWVQRFRREKQSGWKNTGW